MDPYKSKQGSPERIGLEIPVSYLYIALTLLDDL